MDHFSRECPAIEVDQSLTGRRVVALLDRLAASSGLLEVLFVYNGTEFTSRAVDQWPYENKIRLCFSRPGKATDNTFIESFNGRLREECLNQHWFTSLADAKHTIEKWRRAHNKRRPHSSLGYLTPADYLFTHRQTKAPEDAFLTHHCVQKSGASQKARP